MSFKQFLRESQIKKQSKIYNLFGKKFQLKEINRNEKFTDEINVPALFVDEKQLTKFTNTPVKSDTIKRIANLLTSYQVEAEIDIPELQFLYRNRNMNNYNTKEYADIYKKAQTEKLFDKEEDLKNKLLPKNLQIAKEMLNDYHKSLED